MPGTVLLLETQCLLSHTPIHGGDGHRTNKHISGYRITAGEKSTEGEQLSPRGAFHKEPGLDQHGEGVWPKKSSLPLSCAGQSSCSPPPPVSLLPTHLQSSAPSFMAHTGNISEINHLTPLLKTPCGSLAHLAQSPRSSPRAVSPCSLLPVSCRLWSPTSPTLGKG